MIGFTCHVSLPQDPSPQVTWWREKELEDSNNNVSALVSRRVGVNILFPPMDVLISSVGQPLVAGTTYDISCEAAGSRLVPVISWWLAASLMKEMHIVEKIKDVTRPTISFTPTTSRSWRVGQKTP